MGWDDQMRGSHTIDQVHVLSGNGGREYDEMIRGLQIIEEVRVLSGDK